MLKDVEKLFDQIKDFAERLIGWMGGAKQTETLGNSPAFMGNG